jgi:predicted CoA-substrate-specific enzyme activase
MKYLLGIDCGSTSIKAVITDGNGEILRSGYLKNAGIRETLIELIPRLAPEIHEVTGVGTTGSGRDMTSVLIGSDVVESEIIAHFTAAVRIFPDVRTIFDIGGEDCKLLSVSGGELKTFRMNRDCGGGTGATIEAIANRMAVPVDEIGNSAMKSTYPIPIPSKCGIFTQSSVVSRLNRGFSKEDILMGVCRGVVGNFLTMLAKGLDLAPPFVFQGAPARNAALVRCFEEELNHEVLIPPFPHLMGALGAALLAGEEVKTGTKFRGYDCMDENLVMKTRMCDRCENRCEVVSFYSGTVKLGELGRRCAG